MERLIRFGFFCLIAAFSFGLVLTVFLLVMLPISLLVWLGVILLN